MKKTPEVTSAAVATIAGRVLRRIKDGRHVCICRYCSIDELQTLAASVLTQTKDKKRK